MFLSAIRDAQAAMPKMEEKFAEVARPPTRIMSADGVELYRVSSENRIPLKLSQIPVYVRNAILAAEDKRFYSHNGVDEQGLMRAFVSIFKEGHVSQGGSTITMQLAKRLYNGSERSFKRKIEDIAFAYEMEREVANKNRILELYLNQVYFGQGAHGIGAAAKVYFNKTIDKLSISDAALLARCVRLPSKENPIRNLKVSMQNRDVVLGIMRDEHMITESEYQKALEEEPKINKHPPSTTAFYTAGYAMHFVEHVKHILEDELPGVDLSSGGYTIYTTLDAHLQRLAEKTVRAVVAKNRGNNMNTGAFVAIDSDGRILCEASGVEPFEKSQYNIIEQGHLQPGSGFKPFLYATALKMGAIDRNSWLSNAPIRVVDDLGRAWEPKNASPRENASGYSVEDALAQSVNLPAIHTMQKVGPHVVAQEAYNTFGFRTKLAEYLPLALGSTAVNPLEMAEGYSVFMLKGDRVHPYPVDRIVGPDGEVVKQFYPERTNAVLDARVCDDMDYLLRAVVEHGTGFPARDIPDARGKTGTTNAAKDAWFNGYTDGVLGIAWVGNQRIVKGKWTELPMKSAVFGGTTAVYIWHDVMKEARERHMKKPESQPPAEIATTAPATDNKPAEPKPERHVDIPPAPSPEEIAARRKKDDGTVVKLPHPKPDQNRDGGDAPPPDDPVTIDNNDVDNPKPRKRDRQRDSEGQTVTVEICADSGQLATAYCPETVTRSYPKGREPKRFCRIHRGGD